MTPAQQEKLTKALEMVINHRLTTEKVVENNDDNHIVEYDIDVDESTSWKSPFMNEKGEQLMRIRVAYKTTHRYRIQSKSVFEEYKGGSVKSGHVHTSHWEGMSVQEFVYKFTNGKVWKEISNPEIKITEFVKYD